MKKTTLCLLLALCAAALPCHAQLLWKVTGKGLAAPSYIMGTYHLAKTAFADSVPGLKEALAEAGQVYGELDMREALSPENVQKMQQAMTLPGDSTIAQTLTPEEMERLNAFMAKTLGADLTNPMLTPLKNFTPAALNVQLQAFLAMQLEPDFNVNEQFDTWFQQQAAAAGKPTGGLETADFQTETLLKSGTRKRQAELLMCLVDNAAYQKDLLARTVKAYYAQDLKAIGEVTEEKLGSRCDATPAEEDLLIYGRNARWAKKLPAIMRERGTFFAVGAAHLPGERGLIALLRADGYDVRPVAQ